MPTHSTPHRGKAILMTGCSSGIGWDAAISLAKKGYFVFAGIRSEEDAQRIWNLGLPALQPIHLDVTDESTIHEAIHHISQVVGKQGLYALINNAGIVVPGPLECLPLEQLQRQLEINALGPLRLTQLALPLLRKAKGRIINVGSVAGREALPMMAAYSGSKFLLRVWSDALRAELAPWTIKVTLIEPGPVKTPLWGKSKELPFSLALNNPIDQQYSQAMQRVQQLATDAENNGVDVAAVTKSITTVLNSRKPKARYLVGNHRAWPFLVHHLFPQSWKDKLKQRLVWPVET